VDLATINKLIAHYTPQQTLKQGVANRLCYSSVIQSFHNCSEIMSLLDRRQLHGANRSKQE